MEGEAAVMSCVDILTAHLRLGDGGLSCSHRRFVVFIAQSEKKPVQTRRKPCAGSSLLLVVISRVKKNRSDLYGGLSKLLTVMYELNVHPTSYCMRTEDGDG